jgi:[ribosomal protein S5]-alanine N-acetyltransferase
MVFETKRLIIRKARPEKQDIDFFFAIWTNPKVMTFVGFPQGLRTTRDKIRRQISDWGNSAMDSKLVVELKETADLIGECKLGTPDDSGVSETDVKLLPQYWGKGYGTEIKRGLVDWLFSNTDCKVVRATPNQKNIASQKMQEAVGGRRIDEGVCKFPESMRDYTVDVPYYVYEVTRETWEQRNV